MKRKTLALFAGSELTKETLCNQLRYYLDDYMDIQGYSEEVEIKEVVKADLVIMSSNVLADEMCCYVDESCPILIAQRLLNIENMEKLFSIQRGTSVYFVNDIRENVFLCIEFLKEIGIDYLDYIPYYPGCRIYRTADIAITAGEPSLAPKDVRQIIDLGARIIDISTIIEILKHLGLMEEKLALVSAKYRETMIRFNKNLYHLFNEVSGTNQQMAKILNQINDGIIAFDGQGRLSIFNEKSKAIFGAHIVGEAIQKTTFDPQVKAYLLSDDFTDRIVNVHGDHFIVSKFRIDKMDMTVCTVKNAKESKDIETKLRQSLVKKGYFGKYKFSDIIGPSQVMQDTLRIAKKLSKSDLNILIYGESGVGKELFASAIHNESGRQQGPFLAINFSALPEELVESELFGYEEGAFTGAKKGGRVGIFEQANQGTIFLDEIGDISPRIQARLLRVLQEKEIRRIGGSENIPIDVRVIAATNKDLIQMCKEDSFREDLYHRLRKCYLNIPPLKIRREDIDPLIGFFSRKHGAESLHIPDDILQLIADHPWSGNVRELENTIEYFIAVSEDGCVDRADLPDDFFDSPVRRGKAEFDYAEQLSNKGNLEEYGYFLEAIKAHTDQGLTISRKKLADLAKEHFPYMTEERVRRKTDDLQALGLITKSVGRIGMRLTTIGVKNMTNITQKRPI